MENNIIYNTDSSSANTSNNSIKIKNSPQSWDDNDDKLLIQLKEIQHLGWKQIAKYFNNRTSNACQFRWRRLKSGQLKKISKNTTINLKNLSNINNKESDDESNSEISISNRILNNNSTAISNDIKNPLILNTNNNNNNNNNNNLYWTLEEDNLIRSRNSKNLSTVELSILLPKKTINEIKNRIMFLERKKLSISSLLIDNTNSNDEIPNLSNTCSNTPESEIDTYTFPNSNKPYYPQQQQQQQQQPFSVYQTSAIVLPTLNDDKKISTGTSTGNTTPISNNHFFINSITTPSGNKLPSLSQVYSFINQ